MSLCPGNLSSYQSINYKKVGLTQKKNDTSHATPTEKSASLRCQRQTRPAFLLE